MIPTEIKSSIIFYCHFRFQWEPCFSSSTEEGKCDTCKLKFIVDVMSLHGEFYKFKLYEQCHFSSFVLSGDCHKVKIVIVFSKYVAEVLEQFYNTQQLILICRNAW